MSNLNQMQAIGYTGRAAGLKYTNTGRAVADFSLAVNEKWTDAQGQQQERTLWLKCVMWGALAESVWQYVTKGKQVYVSGRLSVEAWAGNDGEPRATAVITVRDLVLLGGRGEAQEPMPTQAELDEQEELPF